MFKRTMANQDARISYAIMSPFVILTLQYFLIANISQVGLNLSIFIQFFSKILVSISFLYALPIVLKRNFNSFIYIYIISIFIFSVYYLIFSVNRPQMNELIFPIFFMSIPLLIFTVNLVKYNDFYNIMIKASHIIFIFGIILSIEDLIGIVNLGDYSGPLANYLLIPCVVYMHQFFYNNKIRYLIGASLCLSAILLLGSRGAVLCITFFVIIKFIFDNHFESYKQIFVQSIFFILTIYIFLNLKQFLTTLYIFLLNKGIHSRSIKLFLEDNVHLSGRDEIYDTMIRSIINNPIIGYGIGGDRTLLLNQAVYAHNIVLELFIDYGIIIGSLLIFLFIILLTFILIKSSKEKKRLIYIWLSLGFVHLMLSSSYLIEMKFWILLGFIINFCFIKRNESRD